MVSATLLVASFVAFVTATVFAVVGARLFQRAASTHPTRRAIDFFVLWWYASAANIYIGGAFYFAAAFGLFQFDLQLAYTIIQRMLLAASLWGLLTYLIFLVRGTDRRLAVGTFYALHGLFLVYAILARNPTSVYIGAWRTDLNYALEAPAWHALVTLVGVVLPPLFLSIAYLVVALRMPPEAREQRYRATLVSTSMIAWWAVAVVAGQRTQFDVGWLQLLNRLIGLGAALVILAAYLPPAWIRRRLRLEAKPGAA